jgi:hypothetical protein
MQEQESHVVVVVVKIRPAFHTQEKEQTERNA